MSDTPMSDTREITLTVTVDLEPLRRAARAGAESDLRGQRTGWGNPQGAAYAAVYEEARRHVTALARSPETAETVRRLVAKMWPDALREAVRSALAKEARKVAKSADVAALVALVEGR